MPRRTIILATTLALTAACGGDDDDAPPDSSARADSIAAAMAATSADSAARAAQQDLQAFYDRGPLPPGASREDVTRRFGEPRDVRVETEPNRHVPDAVDSLFHMIYDEAEVTVRRASGRDLMERAVVRSNAQLGEAPPLIGVSDAEIRQRFGEPEGTPEGNFLYRCDTCSELGGNAIVFHLGKGGAVEAVEIHYPID